MKPIRYKKWAVLALALAGGFLAAAQSNDVPGPTAYPAFSGFITERNIFDPARQPHNSNSRQTYRPRVSRSAPAFTLVGTMSYEKGMFAFFDGNNSDLRKVLYQTDSNSIAGYNVAEITLAGVKLQTADKKETVQMKIGDLMRQEGSVWHLAGKGELSADPAAGEGASSPSENAGPEAGAASSPAIDGNDVLKKLMQKREQELK